MSDNETMMDVVIRVLQKNMKDGRITRMSALDTMILASVLVHDIVEYSRKRGYDFTKKVRSK